MPAPWPDGPAGWQPREWLIPSITEICLYPGDKGIAAEERLLLPVLQLGDNGSFEEKNIEIKNSRSECRKNYRYGLLLSLEVETIINQGFF